MDFQLFLPHERALSAFPAPLPCQEIGKFFCEGV